MPRQLFAFDVTIPLGTPVVSPVTVNLTMPPRVVRRVSWRVPPGPAGLMGWALAAAGQPMIPVNSGQWIVTNDESDTWDVEQYLTSGAWQLMGWNTGLFDHHVYLRFQVDLVQDLNTVQPVAPIPVDQLAPFTAADLAAVTSGNLSADALASLASVPAVDPSLGGVQ